MGHTMVAWKILEELLIELRKKGIQVPVNVLEDLRAVRSMIFLSCTDNTPKGAVVKAEAYAANVEAYLISQAQEVFEPSIVDEWLKRLKEANLCVYKESDEVESRFIVGVPRSLKWVRIETDNKLSENYVFNLAEEWRLTVNKQTDGRIMVYGQIDDIKAFVKQITVKHASYF
jgi:hypothetical protein